MPIFDYKARNKMGRKIKGDLDAPTLDMAENILRKKGLQDVKVKPKPKDLFEGTPLEKGVSSRDMVVFSRQFATMINSGVPILQALQIMCEQTENDKLRHALFDIRNNIESGSSLYDAMKKYPDVFDTLYTNMVDAGETGGVLDTVLLRLSEYIEKAANLKAKVKGAMIYPTVVLIVALLVVAIILLFVIPSFEKVFANFGGALPAPTQFVVNLSDLVQDKFFWLVGGLVVLIIGFRLFYKWERGRILVDNWILFFPVIGRLLRIAAVAKFSRTLSTMIASGVPILDSLDIVSRTSGNKTVELGVLKARDSIAEGQTIAEPLGETGVFPPMVTHMISIGETTGALDNMLEKVADFYDDEVDVAVDALTSMIEPIMIVFLGVVVGGMVVSMYLPIFNIAGTLG